VYESYFGLSERPFSIAPDPQYLFMSRQHQEAMAHLRYGLTQGGGFILLTGEVGTGKTTLCRNLLSALPDNVNVALILNANIKEDELLQTICDELKIKYKVKDTQKTLLKNLNDFLLKGFSNNRRTVLIIDEAQLLSRDVLEQIRMLTNLETTKAKLLQIILIGQPELNEVLARRDLRQLAQRITARYHLKSIEKQDITEYVTTRLKVAGCTRPLFTKQALSKVFSLTKGIPRLINVLCDNALLVAYSKNSDIVDAKIVKLASKEIISPVTVRQPSKVLGFLKSNLKQLAMAGLACLLLFLFNQQSHNLNSNQSSNLNSSQSSEVAHSDSKPLPAVDKPVLNNSVTGSSQKQVKVASQSKTDSQSNAQATNKTNAQEALNIEAQKNELSKLVFDLSNPVISAGTRIDDLEALITSPSVDTTRASAFRNLASLWGLTLPVKAIAPLCDSVRELGLDCFVGNDNLEGVLSYNRPASLVLTSNEGTHRALLIGANQNEVALDVDGGTYRVSRETLLKHWNGAFLMYWQRPRISSYVFSEGTIGSRVVWLRQQINFALRKAGSSSGLKNTTSTLYDAELAAAVSQLQSESGLNVDGQVGMKTVMMINRLIDSAVVPTVKVLQELPPKESNNDSSLVVDQELS